MKKFAWRYGAVIAWAALLFILSSFSDLTFPVQVFSWDDKIQHALAYMPLGWLLMHALVWKNTARPRDLGLALIIGSLYGVSDEIHQHFVPGRYMDWTDAAADAMGIILGSGIFYLWRLPRETRPDENSVSAETAD